MDIFSYESGRRIGEQNVLRKVDALIDWPAISALLRSGLNRSGLGPQGYDEVVLFKCLLLGQWHALSDPKLEEAKFTNQVHHLIMVVQWEETTASSILTSVLN